MKKLLHIIASPRGDDSRTLKVSRAFLEKFRSARPDWAVEELNLYTEELPELTAKRVDGKYVLLGGKELYGPLQESWEDIIREIERFLSADAFLLSTPMWNFSIPYRLKQYIDIIVQPKYLFRYTDKGVEGLAAGRKMLVITSRGGNYQGGATAFDHQEPYLRTVFGFVGVTDITFVKAEDMDSSGEKGREESIRKAQEECRRLAGSW
jgi:FMN-dependent NADH-azoreductase